MGLKCRPKYTIFVGSPKNDYFLLKSHLKKLDRMKFFIKLIFYGQVDVYEYENMKIVLV